MRRHLEDQGRPAKKGLVKSAHAAGVGDIGKFLDTLPVLIAVAAGVGEGLSVRLGSIVAVGMGVGVSAGAGMERCTLIVSAKRLRLSTWALAVEAPKSTSVRRGVQVASLKC